MLEYYNPNYCQKEISLGCGRVPETDKHLKTIYNRGRVTEFAYGRVTESAVAVFRKPFLMWQGSRNHLLMWQGSWNHILMWQGSWNHLLMWQGSWNHLLMWQGSWNHLLMWQDSWNYLLMWQGSWNHLLMWQNSWIGQAFKNHLLPYMVAHNGGKIETLDNHG